MNIHFKKSNTLIGSIQISFYVISLIRNTEAVCRYQNEGNPAAINVPVAPNNLHTILPTIPSADAVKIRCNSNPTMEGSIPSDIGLYTKLTYLLVY